MILLEVILAWTFKNKGPNEEFNLTFQNIYYDPSTRLLKLGRGGFGGNFAGKKLFLSSFSWEEREPVSINEKPEKLDLWTAVDLGIDKAVIKNRLVGFVDLVKKSNQIKNEIENFSLEQFISHLSNFEKYQKLETELYELESFFKRLTNVTLVKVIAEEELKICQELKVWKNKNIPNLSLKKLEQATKNEFNAISDGGEISSQGFYKGFSIFRTEQRKEKQTGSFGSGGIVMKNCYTKTNIDLFRQLFPNNLDQCDPQYFRGFQPGDLVRGHRGAILYLSEKAVQEDLANFYIVKPDLPFQTKTCLDLLEARKLNEFLEILCSSPTGYLEIAGANKTQHSEKYQDAIKKGDISALSSDEKTILNDFCSQTLDLFLVLDQNYSAENRAACQKGLKYLEDLKEDLTQWGKKIITRFQGEIDTKKTEIQQRITLLGSPLIDQIRASAGEKYGNSKKKVLSPERAQLFTNPTYMALITNPELLTKIKELLNVLISVEEEKLNSNDNQEIRSTLTDLKNRWKNGSQNYKKSYEIVNKVDNQCADRLISQLESRIGNENNPPNSVPEQNLPVWTIGLVIGGIFLAIGFILLLFSKKNGKTK